MLTELDHLRMDRPVEDVVRRGRALRRRRRAPLALGAVVLLAGGLLLIDGQPQQPQQPEQPQRDTALVFAAWTSTPSPGKAETVANIDAVCADGNFPGVSPMLVDERGGYAVSLYLDGNKVGDCRSAVWPRGRDDYGAAGPGGWAQLGGGFGPVEHRSELGPDKAVAVEAVAREVYPVFDAAAPEVYGWVRPDVDRVVVLSPVGPVTASVGDGAFLAWWPEQIKEGSVGESSTYGPTTPGAEQSLTVVAYDAAGVELSRTVADLPAPR